MAERDGHPDQALHEPGDGARRPEEGVTPLEMAYAYSTIANSGKRVSRHARRRRRGARWRSRRSSERQDDASKNEAETKRVYAEDVGEQMHAQMLARRGRRAAPARTRHVGEFAAGKTGTTENYGDAWFVGFNDKYTVAVWVGYPDQLQYMRPSTTASRWRAAPSRPRSGTTSCSRRSRIDDARDPTRTTTTARTAPCPTAPPRPRRAPAPEQRRAEPRAATRRRRRRRPAPAPHADARAGAGTAPASRPGARAGRRRRTPRGGGGGRRRRRRPRTAQAAARPRRARASPPASGRETQAAASASQKRHGSSTALVIPIRVAGDDRAASGSAGGQDLDRPARERRAVQVEPDAERLGELAGARAEVLVARRGRAGARIRSMPSSGSSARISTAAPTPSSSATAFSSAWMP